MLYITLSNYQIKVAYMAVGIGITYNNYRHIHLYEITSVITEHVVPFTWLVEHSSFEPVHT